MRSKILLVVFILLSVKTYFLQAQSGEIYNFSLEEATNFALQNNKLIKNAKLAVHASEKQKWQTISQYLPQANVSMDYIDYFNYELEFSFGGGGTTPDINYALLDAGDQEILKLLQGIMAPSEPTKIVLDNSASAKFQVNQLILNGPLIIAINSAKIAQKLSEQSLEKTQEDVKMIIISAYYGVLLTKETLNILDNNIRNLQKNVEQSQAAFKAGIIESSDIDQIKIALANLQNSYNSIERNLEVSNNMLKFQLGLELNSQIILTDSLEGFIKNLDAQNILLTPFNIENNIDYQILTTQEQLTHNMVNMQRVNYLPTIAGFYSYNEKIITTDFDMNPKNLAGISLSWPVFTSGLRNAKIQEAKINLEQIKTSKDMVNTQLILQENQYRSNLKSAVDNYEVQKENMDLAKRVYENYERKYNQGIISSLELTTVNNNYLIAQNNYISSILFVLQSKLALDKLLNNL
ncbi:MAG: TolC family protein [Bacteroidales bacterium]|nr:TolC family protein [Bacteroidales bacterium]